MLPRELSLLVCRSVLSTCLICTVNFQSDVMGSQGSAGWMNCYREKKNPICAATQVNFWALCRAVD